MTPETVARIGAFMQEMTRLSGIPLLWRYPPHQGILPFGQTFHGNPYCSGIKAIRSRHRTCIRFEDSLAELSAQHAGAFTKTCHAGVVEWVYPMREGNACCGFLIAGPFRQARSGCPHADMETAFFDLPVHNRALARRMNLILGFLNEHIQMQFRMDAESPLAASRIDDRIKKAMRFIDERPYASSSVPVVAKACALSPSRLIHLFRSETGSSLVQYRTQARIEQAKRRLVTTDQSLTTIALDLGFTDQSHFGSVFRRSTGLSPRLFRLRQRGSANA